MTWAISMSNEDETRVYTCNHCGTKVFIYNSDTMYISCSCGNTVLNSCWWGERISDKALYRRKGFP
jgi:DNA-directed RNA polymerase subunit RPC12/RpoP